MANLTVPEMYLFLTGDFEDAWDSIAINPAAKGRGNFTFALKAMILLEWASRLCTGAPGLMSSLANELASIEPRYFTRFGGITNKEVWINEAKLALPSLGSGPKHAQLLWILFDLIRNGEAHQYQQIGVRFSDSAELILMLTGAEHGYTLQAIRTTRSQWRSDRHLCFGRDANGTLGVLVMPAMLYLDFREAIDKAGIVSKASSFPYIGPRSYPIPSASFEQDLISAGHRRL